MFNLIRRLWPAKGRHRGKPALVRGVESQGATEDWSPLAEFAVAEEGEPEETPLGAAELVAEEIRDHWALEYARFEAEVKSWFDELVRNDPIAQVLLAEERERLARKASVEAAGQVDVKTGEYPLVREAAMV